MGTLKDTLLFLGIAIKKAVLKKFKNFTKKTTCA